ncbi:MAG: DUF4268 domain-containing protein [Acidimicrobiales bacterium]|nr:DUF4268 domain-containing protein [Acidimicrobiales bacterium]
MRDVEALGRLESLDARKVWVHEAYDFTPWLLENSEVLANVLGIDLELSTAEHTVGDFSLDLIGRDNTNDCMLIVENQLTGTDHDHLGKLVTYAAGTEARTVVWLATAFREEHRQAVDYLNQLAGENARFFGVRIGVVKIGESSPAPLFELVAQPNDWAAHTATTAKVAAGQAGKGPLYQEFWTRLLKRIHDEHPAWTNAHKPGPANWTSLLWFTPGVGFNVSFRNQQRISVEVYLDTGDEDGSLTLYKTLQAERPAIEQAFGGPLSWEELEKKRACRIAVYRPGDVTKSDEYDQYIDWLFDNYRRLRNAVGSLFDKPTIQ